MKVNLFLLIFSLSLNLCFGQYNKEKLEEKNANLLVEIAKLEQELQINAKESTTSLLYIKTLNEKLQKQERLVRNIRREKRILDDEIYLKQLEINQLNRELRDLRSDFKSFLVTSYKKKPLQNKFLFVFSAKSLTEIYRRLHYLKVFSQFQNVQAQEIISRQTKIKEVKAKREEAKAEKQLLLDKEKIFMQDIIAERKQKKAVLAKIEENKEKILEKINTSQKEQKRLEQEIKLVIEKEIRDAEIAEAKRKEKEAEELRRKAEEERLRRQKEAELTKQRAEEDRKRKEAETLAVKLAEEERLKKENELVKILAKEEEKRRQLEISQAEKEKRRKQIEAEKQLQKAEEKRIAKEKELAKIEAEEERRKLELKLADQKRKEKEKERLALEEKKRREYENSTASNQGKTNNNFAFAKGNLPTPLAGGKIVSRYGRQPHPYLNGITVENNGVDLAGRSGSKAKAVFDGKVSTIYLLPGGNKAVLLEHGNYYTLYHNLTALYVTKGTRVSQGQSIGEIYTDSEGNTILSFQVWKETQTQNPEIWVKDL